MGRIRNDSTGVVIRGHKTIYGYLRVRLMGKQYTVHSLVAKYFIGDRPTGLVVNHKNFVKTDNRAANLEYVTYAENHSHSKRHERHAHGENHGMAKLRAKTISDIRRLYIRGNGGRHNKGNVMQLAKKFGVHKDTVVKLVSGKTWAHL